MFTIYADNKLIHDPLYEDLTILTPKLTLEMGKAGSFQFTVPPMHQYFSQFHQLKTIVTVELDGVEIFRGRVLTNNRAFNNTRTIYCEGDLSYLVDSVQRAEKYTGRTHDLFRKIIENHNKRVDAAKQFTVGQIGIEDREIILTGQSEEDRDLDTGAIDYKQIVINSIADNWKSSFDYIETCLIDYCGGYLRTRRVGDTTYIDLLTDFGNTATQEIEFGVNMLDFEEEVSAEDIFTVLIPLGDENLTIASVNGGSDELVDTAAVERFGRIVKTNVFSNVTSASTLLENGQRYLASHVNVPVTITVKAVDMHLVDPEIKEIYIGDKVRLRSHPHSLSDTLTCTKIEYDLESPENTEYTFGNPRQTLTERYRKDKLAKEDEDKEQAATSGGVGGGGAYSEADEMVDDKLDEFFDAWIDMDKASGTVSLGALYRKYQNATMLLEHKLGIDLDAKAGTIEIKTLREEFDEVGQQISDSATRIEQINNELTTSINSVASRTSKIEGNLGGVATSIAELYQTATDTQASIKANSEHIELVDGTVTKAQGTLNMLQTNNKSTVELVSSFVGGFDRTKLIPDGKIKEVCLSDGPTEEDMAQLKTNLNSLGDLIIHEVDEVTAGVKELTDANKASAELFAEFKTNTETFKASIETWAGVDPVTHKIGTKIAMKADVLDLTQVKKVIVDSLDAYVVSADGLGARSAVVSSLEVLHDAIVSGTLKVKSLVVTSGGGSHGTNTYAVATEKWVTDQKFATQEWVEEKLKGYSTTKHTHSNIPDHTHGVAIRMTSEHGHTHTITINGKSYTTGDPTIYSVTGDTSTQKYPGK